MMNSTTLSLRPSIFIALLHLLCQFLAAANDGSCKHSPTLTDDVGDQWQNCHVFLAPSPNNMGWGVFAARDFVKGELVEVSPLELAISHNHPAVRNSVLDDYIYGWQRRSINSTSNEHVMELLSMVSWGMVMYYNHHDTPNVDWTILGGEPDERFPESMIAVGIVAIEDIKAGSEMFYTYGGKQWFLERRIEQIQSPAGGTIIPTRVLENMKAEYCSKLFSGVNYDTFFTRMMSSRDSRFSLWKDAAKLLPSALTGTAEHAIFGFSSIAKTPISAGERILISPGLLVDNRFVHGSSLAPLVFAWDDLDETNQHTIKTLRHNGHIRLQYQGQDTNWHRIDRFEHFEHLAIVSEATLVDRVGPQAVDANCRLAISASGSRDDSAGILVELIATKNIEAGQTIKLNLPAAGQGLLYKELQKMGAVRLKNAEVGSVRDESCLVTVGS